MTLAHEQIIDFILAGKTLGEVIQFKASEPVRERVTDLIRREKAEGLDSAEKAPGVRPGLRRRATQELEIRLPLLPCMRGTRLRN